MLQKKSNMLGAMLTAISLFSYATLSPAADVPSSNFDIRLFNNTSINQPLYYYVNSEGQHSYAGTLAYGDEQGQLIKIDSKAKDKAQAEIVVKDSKGHTVWGSHVSYWGSTGA